jgi:BirA family biotin operon repressor/biotin-[acetyl-CoA-carboxylase] ligase
LKSNPSDPAVRHALPDDLAEALAGVALAPLGSSIRHFTTIGSTNDVALTLAAHGDHAGSIVIADEQTAGRGRRGRQWFSPPGSGVYVSVVLAPGQAREDPARATMLLTIAAGVALVEGIEAATGLRADLKWPNDVLLSRRKLAGILAEAESAAVVVLGYGVNVGPMAYPPELRERATSLESELGRRIDRAAVCGRTLEALARRYGDLLEGRFDAILDAWRGRSPASRGARVSWPGPQGIEQGVTAGIDERGALLVRVGGRVERIVAGELTWL